MTITLYRGDATRIKRFEVGKTNSHCLLGRGIYLTTKRTVADTYRDKGSLERSKIHTLFSGKALHKEDAMKKGFAAFVELMYERRMGKALDAKLYQAEALKQRHTWLNLLDEGQITVKYLARSLSSQQPILEVKWEEELSGFISTFVFPRKLLESNIINVGQRVQDRSFWELMYDNKIGIGTPYDTRGDYIKYNMLTAPGTSYSRFCWDKLRALLEKYGIIGLEYPGGVITCNERHRAFVLWDEDFVNRHRISVQR